MAHSSLSPLQPSTLSSGSIGPGDELRAKVPPGDGIIPNLAVGHDPAMRGSAFPNDSLPRRLQIRTRPNNSSTCTVPSSQTFERSFRTRSTTITFSDRSLLLCSNSSLLLLSLTAFPGIRLEVPLIGCDNIFVPSFFKKRFTIPITLAILIAFFNQMSGINAVIYFAPRVFELAGIGKSAAFLQSAGIGLVNLVFTMLGLYLIDKIGRKKLMLIGSIGYIVSLGAVAAAFYFQFSGGIIVPVLLFFFIASHAIGQGAVIWVFISEIFPNQVRSYGQSLGSSVHWTMAALVTSVFPFFANDPRIGPAKIFLFFTVMMLLQLLWVLLKMPETKGISLEQLESKLSGKTNEREKIAIDKYAEGLNIK